MGQVISFPGKREKRHLITDERRAAFITGLCALTYLLGFFIVGPSLAIFAFGFVTTSHLASALACVAGLLVTWPITRYAYKRL
jgi:predicted Kef-type K+ transport protein